MFPPIFEVCSEDASVLAVLGTSPVRFWLFGKAPTNPPLPYSVWQQVGGSPENYINQVPDIDGYSIQVDVYGGTAAEVRNAAQVMRNAIEPHAHIVAWRGESLEQDTRLYRYSFDIDWLVPRQ